MTECFPYIITQSYRALFKHLYIFNNAFKLIDDFG